MPPLPSQHSMAVYKGLWPNYTAPAYRRWIFTATNVEAILALGFLMLIGAFANDKAWTIMRRVVIRLTAPVRLEDESDIRNELSRSKAISSLVRTMKRKRALEEALQDPGCESVTKISPWFGVAAVVNTIGFVVFGMFLPWLLSEGLQGEPIVTAGNATSAVPIYVTAIATAQDIRDSVEADYKRCKFHLSVVYTGDEEECHVIRHDSPIVQKTWLSLDDALLRSPEYHFITANVANRTSILHFSQNITLKHLGINENSNMRIRHQLACAPANLDRLVAREEKKHRIYLLPTHIVNNMRGYIIPDATWDMPLLTSNKLGSGRTILGSNDPKVETWDLSMADVVLPYVPEFQTSYYANQQPLTILNGLERRFLIIHRASGRGYQTPIDDPFFAAHDEFIIPEGSDVRPAVEPNLRSVFLNDREATALGCVELLDICTPRIGGEYCYTQKEISEVMYSQTWQPYDKRLENTPWEKKGTLSNLFAYLPVLSVWIHAQLAPLSDLILPTPFEPTWALHLEEHFVRSVLRLRLVYRTAVSRTLALYSLQRTSPSVKYNASFLYRNSDYTNINFIGFLVVLLSYIVIIFWSYAMFVDYQPILSTLRTAASKIWQKVNRITEGSKLLLESATSAMRKGHTYARSRTFNAFRSGHRIVHPRNDGQYSRPQYELPIRTTSGGVNPIDEPDNPLTSARL